ncbi:hypothetical protein [Novipirellula artificiosorum]|uniref:hypothetical protein n=1 Tax=Novipirellula artificiosorum TaxID=2528016 RepID=UPI0011B75F88|nr:hypothetical protein [Novipirellula artificiosorum]
MTCHELARRLAALRPELQSIEIARLSLLILIQAEDEGKLANDDALLSAWKNASFRLEAAADQHAAVADELDQMCNSGPVQFTPDQLWILLRAVKVQSQILELYTDQPALA